MRIHAKCCWLNTQTVLFACNNFVKFNQVCRKNNSYTNFKKAVLFGRCLHKKTKNKPLLFSLNCRASLRTSPRNFSTKLSHKTPSFPTELRKPEKDQSKEFSVITTLLQSGPPIPIFGRQDIDIESKLLTHGYNDKNNLGLIQRSVFVTNSGEIHDHGTSFIFSPHQRKESKVKQLYKSIRFFFQAEYDCFWNIVRKHQTILKIAESNTFHPVFIVVQNTKHT